MKAFVALAIALALPANPPQTSRTVAITIDDVPRGGDGGGQDFETVRALTEKLLRPIREGAIPVAGFVVGQSAERLGQPQAASRRHSRNGRT